MYIIQTVNQRRGGGVFHIYIRMEETRLFFFLLFASCKSARVTHDACMNMNHCCVSTSSTNGGICSQALYTGLVIYAPALALNQSTSCTQSPPDRTDTAECSVFVISNRTWPLGSVGGDRRGVHHLLHFGERCMWHVCYKNKYLITLLKLWIFTSSLRFSYGWMWHYRVDTVLGRT